MREEIPVSLQCLCTLYFQYETDIMTILNDPQGMMKAYEYYKKTLQLLTYQQSDSNENMIPKQWILKCPFHMICINQIKKIFPNAKLIWCHRHPTSAVPSLCSFLKGCHQTYFEDEGLNDIQLGQAVYKTTIEWLKTSPITIEESGLLHHNTIYNNLIDNPINVIKEIYKSFNMKFTPEYEKILNNYLIENRKKRNKMSYNSYTSTTRVIHESKEHSSQIHSSQEHSSQNSKYKNKNIIHKYDPAMYGIHQNELCQGIFKTYVDNYSIPVSSDS